MKKFLGSFFLTIFEFWIDKDDFKYYKLGIRIPLVNYCFYE